MTPDLNRILFEDEELTVCEDRVDLIKEDLRKATTYLKSLCKLIIEEENRTTLFWYIRHHSSFEKKFNTGLVTLSQRIAERDTAISDLENQLAKLNLN